MSHDWGLTRPNGLDRLSLRQHYLTPLNLIAAETGHRPAMWADDGRPSGDRNPQVRAVNRIG
jgi:hypothetical protein